MPLTRDAHIARWGELVNDERDWRYDTVQIILKALGRSEEVIAQMQPPWRSLREKSNRRVFLESLSTQEIVSVHLEKLKKALDA
jgi:predicted transcriptional regulator